MKKLVVLTALLAVAGVLWAQAAPAAPSYPQFSYNGNFNYGVLTDFAKEPVQFLDMRNVFKVQLDANNFVQMRIRAKLADMLPWVDTDWKLPSNIETRNTTTGATTFTKKGSGARELQSGLRWDQAYVQSNLTGAFGVKAPVASSVMYGIVNTQFSDITGGISPFEVADLSGNDIGDRFQPIIAPWVTFNNLITIKGIVAPNVWGTTYDYPEPQTTKRGVQGWEVAAYGAQGPIAAEVGGGDVLAGGANNNPRDSQIAWAGAKYTGAAGDLAYALAVNGQYNWGKVDGFGLRNHYALASNDATDDTTYGYGVAAMANYKKGMAIVKGGLVGVEGSMTNRAELQAIFQPMPQIAFDIGAVLNLDTGTDGYLRYFGGPQDSAVSGTTPADVKMLNDLDVAMIINVGKVPYRIGYLYKDKNAPYSVQADDIGRVGDSTHVTKTPDGSSLIHGNTQGGLYISVILAY